jgi:AcrR family transcriptional regulator
MVPPVRQTAQARRTAVVAAARSHFADHGYHGASTEAIARDAGISQPYLFRLFGTKKELFNESMRGCMLETLNAFKEAADGLSGPEAFAAVGERYKELLGDRQMLKTQMQMYAAACTDPDIRDAAREGYGALYEYIARVSGADPAAVSNFFAQGMLINVIAALELESDGSAWSQRLVSGCLEAHS